MSMDDIKKMDNWDPRKDDFQNKQFNSYIRGPGRNLSVKGSEKHIQLYVTGIPQELTLEGLESLFGRAGTVVRVKILPSKRGSGQDTFGFVTMATLSDAERAIAQLDNFRVGRFTLKVSVALSREELERKKQQKQELNLMTARGWDEGSSDSESIDKELAGQKKMMNGVGDKPAATSAMGTGRGQKLREITQEMFRQPSPYAFHSNSLLSQTGLSKTVSPAGDAKLTKQMVNLSVQVDRGAYGFSDPAGQHTPMGQGRYIQNYQDEYRNDSDYGSNSWMGKRGRGGRGRGFYSRGGRRDVGGYYQNYYENYNGGYEYEAGYGGGYQPPYMGRGMYNPKMYVDQYAGMMGAPQLLQPAMVQTPVMHSTMQQQIALQQQTLMQQPTSMQHTPVVKQKPKQAEKILCQECSVCGLLGTSRCSKCKVPYCSQACQERDWPEHKFVCGTLSKEKEVTDPFSDFDVDAGDDLIPQVKQLMEKATGETILVTKKSDYSPGSRSDTGSSMSDSTRDKRRVQLKHNTANVKGSAEIGEKGRQNDDQRVQKRNVEESSTQRTKTTDKKPAKKEKEDRACFNCGGTSHLRSDCPMPANYKAECYHCHKLGHLSKDCPLKGENQPKSTLDKNMNVKQKTSPVVTVDEKWDEYSKPASGPKTTKQVRESAGEDVKVAMTKSPPSAPPKKTLPVASMPLNQEIMVVITEVKDPGYFYVQMAIEEIMLQSRDLMVLMHKTFSDSSPDVKEVLQGEIYAVKYSLDGSWCRAQVVKVTGGNIHVQFLDFGNEENTSLENMRQLTSEMMKLPAQGVLCALEGILPKTGNAWNIPSSQLASYLTADIPYLAECKRVLDSPSGRINVIILKNADGENIAHKLVSAGLVKASGPAESKGAETVSPKGAKPGATPSPKANLSTAGQANTQQSPKTERVILAKEVPKWLDKLTVDEEYPLLIADARSPSDFCIQVLDEENINKFTAFNLEFNEKCKRMPETAYRPQAIGELVASKFSQAEGWYRAEVVELLDKGAKVLYLDYLNSEEVTFNMLHKAMPLFASYPAQGIACRLHGVMEPTNGKWPPEVSSLMEQLSQRMLKGVVKEIKNSVVSIQLKELSGESVNEEIESLLKKDVKKSTGVRGKISPGELPLDGSKVQAMVTNVSAVDSVYVQVLDTDMEKKRNEMMLALNQSLMKSGEMEPYEPKEGDFVAAVYSADGTALWYRGLVQVKVSKNNYMVLFVDYGNTDCVPVGAMAPLELRFMSLPAMAVRCQLAGSEGVTDAETLQNLKSLTDHKMYVKAVDFVGGIFKVEMFLVDGTNVNEAFEFKCNRSTVTPVTKTPPKDTKVSQKEIVESHWNIAESSLPFDGTKVMAKVVLTESLVSFYIHKLDSEMDQKLMDCLKDMQLYYKDDNHIHSGEVGEYVATLYDDGSGEVWYRAKIIRVVGNEVQVSIIDYGNVGFVGKECIRRLDRKFAGLPAIALRCKLNGATGEESSEILEEFCSVETTTVKVHAISKEGDTYLVNLHLCDPVETSVAACLGLNIVQVSKTPEKPAGNDSCSVSKSPVTRMQADSVMSPVSSVVGDYIGLRDLELPVNTDIPAVTYVIESIRSFFIQKADDETQTALANMMLQLGEACQGNTREHAASAGEIVAALFVEGGDANWYRGQVIELIDKNQCKVMFVDYGNTEIVLFRDIRRLETRFLDLPKMAAHCRLAGMGEETEGMLQIFKTISNVPMTVRVKSVQKGIHEVEVITLDHKNMNQELGLVLGAGSPCTEIVDSLPKAVSEGVNRLPKKVSSPPKAERKAVFSQTLEKSGPETEEFKAVITSAVRPNLFHCQVFPEGDQTTLQELAFLSESMQLECEVEFDNIEKQNFEVGELVCAKFPVDNVWYRATVLEVYPDKTVKVEYVDFGNQTEVSITQLRPVTEDHTRLPLLAFRCSLHGVRPAGGSWTKAALEVMSKFQNKPLDAKVVNVTGDVYELDIIDPATSVNMAEHLISVGLAEAEDTPTEGLSEMERLKQEREQLKKELEAMQAKMAAIDRTSK